MGAPLLVIANKQDVMGAMSEIDVQNALGEFENRKVKVVGCSAL